MASNDLQLEHDALEACGYRIIVREKSGSKWLTACKGADYVYEHWHPLTNINQALRLLIECPYTISVYVSKAMIQCGESGRTRFANVHKCEPNPVAIIDAQCRAIVEACAKQKGVRDLQ